MTSGGAAGSPASGGAGGAAGAGTAGAGGSGGATAPGVCKLELTCTSKIVDDPKVPCTLKVSDAAGASIYADQAGVELRGRSSLRYPKKNYGLELRTAAGIENPVPMMGMGKESDWIFDGSWVDRSFMRNDLVFGLFRDLGRYAPESRPCTLTLNGQNQGIYRLTEKIKRDDDRVAVPLDDGSGQSFIISQDADGALNFPVSMTSGSSVWELVYPKQEDATAAQRMAVQSWLDGLRVALTGSDPGNATSGVFSYLDLDATADFILLEELSKNIDAYNLSMTLYRAPGGKASFVPWDFDLAFGQPSTMTAGNERPEGWVQNRTTFITNLCKVEALRTRLASRWRELRAGVLANARIFAKIDGFQAALTQAALTENFAVWPIADVDFTQIYRPYSLYPVSSYAEEVMHFRDWLTARLTWVDAHIDTYPN